MRYWMLWALALPAFENASSEVLCVTNSAELEAALGVVGSNGQSDEIRLRIGQYVAPENGFQASLSDNLPLTLTGGWLPAVLNDCARPDGAAVETELIGDGLSTVLSVSPGTSADVHVARLHIRNGSNQVRGAGLSIGGPAGYVGDVLIEQNIFSQNIGGSFSGGLFVVCDGGDCEVTNNLFYENQSANGAFAALELVSNAPGQTYFTNNTIVANAQLVTGSGTAIFTGSGDKLIANNLFWGNQGQDISLVTSGNSIVVFVANNFESYSAPPALDGGGNLSVNPQFLLPLSQGVFPPTAYRLRLTSPLIDAGTLPAPGESWRVGDVDVLGFDRVNGLSVDIGAFENNARLFVDGFELGISSLNVGWRS